MPGEEDGVFASARRADALVTICSARIAQDPDPDRATVVVHAGANALDSGYGAEVEDGPVIPHETTKRLMCNARIQVVVEDASGAVVGLGRLSRDPSPWMVRQVRYRDKECRFPGCGAKRFTEVHHIVFWHDIVKTVPQQEILSALKRIRALDATVKYPGTLLYHLIQSRRK